MNFQFLFLFFLFVSIAIAKDGYPGVRILLLYFFFFFQLLNNKHPLKFLQRTGRTLCWNVPTSPEGTKWHRLKQNQTATLFAGINDDSLPSPLKDDVKQANDAAFDAKNGLFFVNTLADSSSERMPFTASQLACAYFFKPSDVASLSVDVHSVSIELNGTMFAETAAAAAEVTFLNYSLALCWLNIGSPHCSTPVSGGNNAAGSTDAHYRHAPRQPDV
jgi:hypothetical protein